LINKFLFIPRDEPYIPAEEIEQYLGISKGK